MNSSGLDVPVLCPLSYILAYVCNRTKGDLCPWQQVPTNSFFAFISSLSVCKHFSCINQFSSLLPNTQEGAGETAPYFRARFIYEWDPDSVPTVSQWLATIYNYSSKGSDTFFCRHHALYTVHIHTFKENTNMYEREQNKYFFKYQRKILKRGTQFQRLPTVDWLYIWRCRPS